MSTVWNSQILGKSNGSPNFADLLRDDYAIIFLQGKNTFGDLVYCYVKVMSPDINKMYAILDANNGFNPNDFGTVIAAGKGEPTDEVKAEMAITYPLLPEPMPLALNNMVPPPPAMEKKAWDEY